MGVSAGPLDDSLHQTYFVVARAHYALSLAGAFAFFAFVYFVGGNLLSIAYRWRLAWGHIVLTALGTLLIVAPMAVLDDGPLPRRWSNPEQAFEMLRALSTAGYLITIGGLIVFLILATDALIGRYKSGFGERT